MIIESVGYFFVLLVVFIFFSLPLCVYLLKKEGELDMLLVPVMGFLNLLLGVFIYANINFFVNVRSWNIVLFSVIFWVFEFFLVTFWMRGSGLVFRLVNLKHCLLVLIVSLVIFVFLSNTYFDSGEGKYYHPGYGINHDSVKILSSIKVFSENIGRLDSSMSRSANDLYVLTGYPLGGTFINVFFSRLLKLDPYLLYQRLLVFIFLLNLYVVNYFVLKIFKKVNFLTRVALVFTSVFCVFNYLSLSLVNSSVLGLTAVTPLLFLSIMLSLLVIHAKITRRLFWLLFPTSMVGAVFVYSYINVVYYASFVVLALILYGKAVTKNGLLTHILLVIAIIFLFPINLFLTKILIASQFGSANTEINLFKGMAGNTIGFINPITAFSLWFDNADYRFSAVTVRNVWLFFTLMLPLFLLCIYRDRKLGMENSWRMMGALALPLMFFIGISFWVIKSPYQNVKAMFLFSVIWPLILFLIISRQLGAKKVLARLLSIFYLLILMRYFFRSSLLANSYVGRPIVRSNYELMRVESEICKGDEGKLFVGRDELSIYFLLSCDNIRYYYDRFENNAAFWEVIALNKLSSLDQKCEVDSWKLTAIDFSLYEKVLIDKCFKFENNSFRLLKEYDGYRWYERVR